MLLRLHLMQAILRLVDTPRAVVRSAISGQHLHRDQAANRRRAAALLNKSQTVSVIPPA